MTSRSAVAATLLTMLWAARAGAAGPAPHKILVLPVDGSAEAALRLALTAELVKLAVMLEGEVATAEATFADTALAVGCDPALPACRDEVLGTLGVDELVWATATKEAGQTRVVVRRTSRGSAREISTTLAAGDAVEHLDAGVAPLFEPPPVVTVRRPEPPAPRPEPPTPVDHGDRNTGIALVSGAGVALVVGGILWASYASLQTSIDDHPTRTREDFIDLRALEDRAGTYAITGDVFVLLGLAAGGVGAYYLYRHHQRQRVAIAPAPIAHGVGVTLTWFGGP